MTVKNIPLAPGELEQLRRIDQAARVVFEGLRSARLTKAQRQGLDALGEALFDGTGPREAEPTEAASVAPGTSWADSFVWSDE